MINGNCLTELADEECFAGIWSPLAVNNGRVFRNIEAEFFKPLEMMCKLAMVMEMNAEYNQLSHSAEGRHATLVLIDDF